jgi:CheY-like chemotaxis protein
MPRLTGVQLARAIRSLAAGERTIRIAVTGWGQSRDRHEALEAGFDQHTTIPVDPSEIQSLIAGNQTNVATRIAPLGTTLDQRA